MSPGAEQDECLLDHVAQCIDRIRQFEGSRERFMESILVQDAVIRNLQVLAESTTRLPWSQTVRPSSSCFRQTAPNG